ncbi:MAG: hypothetical protein OXG42_07500 [Chloroflexi bacterium]|nr:hypothetical protein [Chloroflexota bacterium]
MALLTIDKLRFRNILVRGQIPEEQAVELSEALEETLGPLAETSEVDRAVQRAVDQLKLDAAEREARLMQTIYLATAIVLAGLAIATGLIIAFA